jgi:hypothetical protein
MEALRRAGNPIDCQPENRYNLKKEKRPGAALGWGYLMY